MRPLVSIIIVNWNTGKYIEKCIKSLLTQTYENFEIILVDNDSSDDSVKFVEENFSEIKIIRNQSNLGFAEANNIGIKNSKGDFIALFNPDAIAEKDWLSTLIKELQSSKTIGAVGGKLLSIDEQGSNTQVACTWAKMTPYTAHPYYFRNEEPSSKVDYFSGAAMMLNRDVITKVGLLDPDYFLFYEETDWCARMIRAGYDLVYVPTTKVWHSVSSSANPELKNYLMERNRVRFVLKNFDRFNLFIFLVYFTVESLVILAKSLKSGNYSRSKIRIRLIGWNLVNLAKTLGRRKKDFSFIKKNGNLRSYNKSLPLRKIKVSY